MRRSVLTTSVLTTSVLTTTTAGVRGRDVLVVHEGSRRLRWHRDSPEQWRLVGLWPDRQEVDRVLHRIRRAEPVFIVLPPGSDVVTVEDHELAVPLGALTQVSADGGVLELAVPMLDWLPEPLRTRGLLFAEQSDAAVRSGPVALQPPLILEQLSDSCPVRFARRTRLAVSDVQLADVASYVFAVGADPATVTSEASDDVPRMTAALPARRAS